MNSIRVNENMPSQLIVSYAQSTHEQKIYAIRATFPFFYFKIADGHRFPSVDKGFGGKYLKRTLSYQIEKYHTKEKSVCFFFFNSVCRNLTINIYLDKTLITSSEGWS